jgi:hypothetical protein
MRGETLKKMIFLTIILLVSSTSLGCIVCKNILPFPGPTYSPTVASPIPTTPEVSASPSPSTKYITVETDSPPWQYLPNQARVSHPRYYRTADWEMPVPAKGALTPMHHGVIHELEFWNPTDSNKTISVYNLKSAFYESKDTPHKFIQSYDMFFDESEGFYSEFTLSPDERVTVLMYSYINDDSNYDKYKGYFIEPVSVALINVVPYT